MSNQPQAPPTSEFLSVTRQDLQSPNVACVKSNSDSKMVRLELIVKNCPKFKIAKGNHNVYASGTGVCLRAEFVGKKPRATFRGFRSFEKSKRKRRRKIAGTKLQVKSEKRAEQKLTTKKEGDHIQTRLHQEHDLKRLLTNETFTRNNKDSQADLKSSCLDLRVSEKCFELPHENYRTPKKMKPNPMEGFQIFNHFCFFSNSEYPASGELENTSGAVTFTKSQPLDLNLELQEVGRVSSHGRVMPWESITSPNVADDVFKEIAPSLFEEVNFCAEIVNPITDSGLI
eukprot:CAMPEP_0184483648 /NCGR_PEP_ID=MMETSP0113_2-20130426/5326_1 /TAXON_ID=91329 /ORGANISM="Norrisiella sphaerica, Strain BC52" /LENGTH=285 /DNA_ID=CAMNT_0026864199 /DNA_START=233 /DNA_END=1090 /DNA_ORIENTATION=+